MIASSVLRLALECSDCRVFRTHICNIDSSGTFGRKYNRHWLVERNGYRP